MWVFLFHAIPIRPAPRSTRYASNLHNMDDEEDIDIAAAMGFGSFGASKKRKFDHTKSPQAIIESSGANSTKLGVRTKKQVGVEGEETNDLTPAAGVGATSPQHFSAGSPHAGRRLQGGARDFQPGQQNFADDGQSATETVSFGGPPISKAELNYLKFGVKNDRGDTAYFLPSFVEDPWKSLMEGGKQWLILRHRIFDSR